MEGWRLRPATSADAGELLVVSLAAFVSEAQRYGDPHLPPLRETVAGVQTALTDPAQRVVVAEAGAGSGWRPGRLLGAVRVRLADGAEGSQLRVGHIGRLAVVPDARSLGLGAALLAAAEEAAAAAGAERMELFTGAGSEGPLRLYERAGYARVGRLSDDRGVELVVLAKGQNPGSPASHEARVPSVTAE